jgi:hypothetical protein
MSEIPVTTFSAPVLKTSLLQLRDQLSKLSRHNSPLGMLSYRFYSGTTDFQFSWIKGVRTRFEKKPDI